MGTLQKDTRRTLSLMAAHAPACIKVVTTPASMGPANYSVYPHMHMMAYAKGWP